MPRKTSDPKLIALLDQRAKAQADAERWYARLKRAFNRLDKARRAVARLERRIEAHTHPKDGGVMTLEMARLVVRVCAFGVLILAPLLWDVIEALWQTRQRPRARHPTGQRPYPVARPFAPPPAPGGTGATGTD